MAVRPTTATRRSTLKLVQFERFKTTRSCHSEFTVRIFPIALIVIGSLGVAKYLGLIPIGMFHLVGPVLLIALGVALFFRRPRRASCG